MLRKRWLFVFVALMAAMSLVLSACAPGADENVEGTSPPVEEPMDEEPTDEPLDEEPMDEEPMDEDAEMVGGYGGPWLLGSRVVDMEIETSDGERIATLTDILFAFNGDFQFAVFDTSEFLDEGSVVAVEWDTIDSIAATGEVPRLVYPADADTLGQEQSIDVAVLNEENLFVEWSQLGLPGEQDMLLQASDFVDFGATDYDFVNENDEDLGDIHDLILNVETGTVAYALTDVGGFLGIGENTVAIPWEQISYDAEDQIFTAPFTPEDLENAPTVDMATVEEDGFEEDWQQEHEEFWTGFTPGETGMDDDEDMDDEDAEMVGGYGGPWVMGDRLIDLEIETADGEYIATLTDVLFNFDGQIQYIVFDTSEFLEEGGVVAVDWETIQAQPAADTTTAPVFVYTGDTEALGDEPELDAAVLDQQDVIADVEQLGLDADDDRLLQASEFDDFDLSDYDLVNQDGDGLGDLDDVILNLQQGTVAYALAEVGGFLGIGENTVVIPWEEISYNADAEDFVLPVTVDDLEAAPTIDDDLIDDEGFEEGWNEEHDAYWGDFTPEDGAMDDEDLADDDAEMVGGYGGPWVLADRLVDLEIETTDDEYVATLTDILFARNGEIQFVLFDTSEFLDEGGMVAVDWDTIQPEAATDTTTPVLVYAGDEEGLGGEPEIDAAVLEETDLWVDVAQLGLDAEQDNLLQASDFVELDLLDLTDYDLVNQDGEELGDIENLVLNLQDGTVAYALAEIGGFLGIGENTIVVPWGNMDVGAEEGNFMIPVTADELEAAPTLDVDLIDDEGFDEGWNEEHDTYWEGL